MYHSHFVNRLGMTQSTYDLCLLYKSNLFGIVGLQMDNTLILAEVFFANIEEDAIQSAKIMTKAREHLIITKPIKFNDTKIELESNGNIILRQKTYIGGILTVKAFNTSTVSSQGMVRPKLLPKKQYIT